MPHRDENVLSWASDIEENTMHQAQTLSKLPFLAGPVALMPDAHLGMGATVGSVIATKGAIIPAAVGVDIGCGMIAAHTSLTASDLPDSLDGLMSSVESQIPAGVGHAWSRVPKAAETWLSEHQRPDFAGERESKVLKQFGTLGSGNHFVEVCLDKDDEVWLVLHSGSRGIGNQLAQTHIKTAQRLMKDFHIPLEDKDLAYLPQSTAEFTHYMFDLMWAQEYALGNRETMMLALEAALTHHTHPFTILEKINCHHNYTAVEHHGGKDVMVTRKGAIRARLGDRGVIPGSMGTRSYIVTGLGNPSSYDSCSHGAGRRMSRGQAKRELSPESLTAAMGDRTWNSDRASSLVDEHPLAYKDIDQVMEDQKDLVQITHELRQVFNYKG